MRYPSVAAGDLDQVVSWQRLDHDHPTITPLGQRIPPVVELGTHRARVRPLSGQALVNAMQLKPATYYEFTMRVVGDLKPLDRLVWRGQTFHVSAVLNYDARGVFLTIHATTEPLNPNPPS